MTRRDLTIKDAYKEQVSRNGRHTPTMRQQWRPCADDGYHPPAMVICTTTQHGEPSRTVAHHRTSIATTRHSLSPHSKVCAYTCHFPEASATAYATGLRIRPTYAIATKAYAAAFATGLRKRPTYARMAYAFISRCFYAPTAFVIYQASTPI